MINNTKRFPLVLLYVTSLLVLVLLGLQLRQQLSARRTVFVNIGQLLEEYQFKKDLEAGSTQQLYRIRHMADSLNMLQQAAPSPERAAQLEQVNRAFEEYYTRSSQEVSKKVWDRLNPLLEQYGKANKLDLMIGANGTGTVLYGSPETDITPSVTRYVNEQYATGK